MTSRYGLVASKDVRTFLWSALKTSGFFIENNYIADGFDQPVIPIIPAQQVPEFNNLLPGKPYFYYEYETLPSQENWWVTEEIMTLNLVTSNHDFIENVQDFLVNLFRRYDESAKTVNNFFIESNYNKFHFFRIESVTAPKPFESEGGLLLGEMRIHYSYSRLTSTSGIF